MLSNLASYLLGYGAGAAEDTNSTSDDRTSPNVDENVRLTTVPVDDDDWLMVETTRDGERRSSTGSLPNVNLEESWFVTPPPCFTSTGPVTLETSPLENLLIEHPSMSVYTRSTGGSVSSTAGSSSRTAGGRAEGTSQQRGPPPRGARSLSPPVPRRPNANNAAPAPRPRAPLQPNQLHNMQVQALHQAQKHQLMKESQAMRSKQIERQNKTKDKRSRRPKRNDKQKNHSGANNNRKCC